MSDATDVLQAIDQLRRDLSGYHGQLKAHNDLQRHCDHQRERIVELEAIHARDKAENEKLRELAARAYKTARMMCEAWDGPCQSNSDVPSWRVPCPTDERDEQCVFGQLERDMRELGIEVDV